MQEPGDDDPSYSLTKKGELVGGLMVLGIDYKNASEIADKLTEYIDELILDKFKPCRPGMEHVRPCGPHPSGDSFYCVCGCDGAETWCLADAEYWGDNS